MSWSNYSLDHENAALIALLQREDIEVFARQSKSKQKEGDLSDEELALQLYLQDLNLLDTTHHDHQIARSITTAVVDDCFLLEDALNADLQVQADHELALRLQSMPDTAQLTLGTSLTTLQPMIFSITKPRRNPRHASLGTCSE